MYFNNVFKQYGLHFKKRSIKNDYDFAPFKLIKIIHKLDFGRKFFM